MVKLTEHLLALKKSKGSYERATQHPFLEAAGKLTLTASSLQSWLTQDRLYALMGYTSFLGILISKCPAPAQGPTDIGSIQQRKRLTVLAGAMANIDREVGFFEDVSQQNGLDLAARSVGKEGESATGLLAPTTRGYIDYMVATASRGSFEEALVLLWAMEKLYLDAWTYAATFLPSDRTSLDSLSASSQRALLNLIPNWSAPEFVKFVDDIAHLVDEIDSAKLENSHLERIEEVWNTTLWFEEKFWESGWP